ncbi:DUF3298 domain-containing protein [Chryseobacterium sp. MMS23-Vi53]|uniref:DUF3298 domain-containing protein n=1 Tax=Chryseobacterium sp. MMS23-Vi53 TaxID=3386644 RepID=UPI0039E9BA34
MKKKEFIWMILLLCIIFACKEIEFKNNNVQADNPSKLIIDSVIEEDSIKISDSMSMKYSAQLLLFPNLNDKKLLDSIYSNKNITDFSKGGLQKFLVKEKKDLIENSKKIVKFSKLKSRQDWKYVSQMNLKLNKNDYLYIQYYDSKSEEGNKDVYRYKEKVFDLKNHKRMVISDITAMSETKLADLIKVNLSKTTMMQQMQKYDSKAYEILSSLSVPVTNNFYFDDNNLYFHYNMNQLTENYDIGDIIIPVSWDDLKGTLKPEFMQRMKIK